MDVDVAVVGGGPVGLGTAIAARLAGLSVVVFERRGRVVDKACGEGLMPGAVATLARWGVEPTGMPIAGFRYADGRRSVEHRFAGAAGLGVRRLELHRALSARAAELGVVLRQQSVGHEALDEGGVRIGDVTARHLVGADGLHSAVRRDAGLDRRTRGPHRYGVRQHFRVAPWSDLVEVHWQAHTELYVTPVAEDTVGVAVLGRKGLDFAAAVAGCPAVADRLAGAEPVDTIRGAGPLRQRAATRVSGSVALVGDAAGYVDALTGEGLAVGFAGAEALVAALVAGNLDGYDAAWRRVTRAPRLLTEAVLRLATSPLRPAIVPLASTLPAAFGAAIELLARPAPLGSAGRPASSAS